MSNYYVKYLGFLDWKWVLSEFELKRICFELLEWLWFWIFWPHTSSLRKKCQNIGSFRLGCSSFLLLITSVFSLRSDIWKFNWRSLWGFSWCRPWTFGKHTYELIKCLHEFCNDESTKKNHEILLVYLPYEAEHFH